jgi:hypothetical protein
MERLLLPSFDSDKCSSPAGDAVMALGTAACSILSLVPSRTSAPSTFSSICWVSTHLDPLSLALSGASGCVSSSPLLMFRGCLLPVVWPFASRQVQPLNHFPIATPPSPHPPPLRFPPSFIPFFLHSFPLSLCFLPP